NLEPGLIVTDNAHLKLAEQLARKGRSLINLDTLDPGLADDDLKLSLAPDRPALILYTSGSTGQPKGVVHSHRNVLYFAHRVINGLRYSTVDRVAHLAPSSFAGSVTSLFPALLSGSTVCPFDLKLQGLDQLARWLVDEEITIYLSVASIFRHLVTTLTGAE